MGRLFLQTLKETTGHRGQLIDWVSEVGDAVGVRCALVGGCVRDVLLGASVGDFDFVVEGNTKTFAQTLVRHHGGRIRVHPAFGTVTWSTDAGEVDFAMARTETYRHAGALPEVCAGSLEEDLSRRDFSVNAMAVVVSTSEKGTLLDPFGGRADVKQRILRVLHPESFVDDPTRAWRGARYEGRHSLSWSEETVQAWSHACAEQAPHTVSLQRYGNEWDKVCLESNVSSVVEILQNRHILAAIHPDFPSEMSMVTDFSALQSAANGACFGHLDGLKEAFWIRLALEVPEHVRGRLSPFASGVNGRMERWKTSPKALRRTLSALHDTQDLGTWGRLLSGHSGPELLVLFIMSPTTQSAVRWWMDEGRARRSVVTAKALMARGVQQGPPLGVALQAAQMSAWRGESEDHQWTAAFHAAK